MKSGFSPAFPGRLRRLAPLAGRVGAALLGAGALILPARPATAAPPRHTRVEISRDSFLINDEPTLKGRRWEGRSLEGLLPNSRMVQGIFDDTNSATRPRWAYPDTGVWDPERNTAEFVAAMPEWRRHGLLAFTLNLQGGSPTGYGNQGWVNSAFAPDGSLRPDYMARAARIIDRADALGMVVILGLYYFGQADVLTDDAAVQRGVQHAVEWVFDRGYTNVVIEIDNECNGAYRHANLRAEGVAALLAYAQSLQRAGRHLLCSVSYTGGRLPSPEIARRADFVLLHGNGVKDPARITAMVAQTRTLLAGATKPIVFNEDDHFDFDRPENNFTAATKARASWGFFDYRMKGETFADGYQSLPVNWGLSSERKRDFFKLLALITGQ